MSMFDIRTGYLIVGFLYLLTPAVTWVVLAPERSKSALLWCSGGFLLGIGTILASFTQVATDSIWHLTTGFLLLMSALVRAHALLVFIDRGFEPRLWLLLSVIYVGLYGAQGLYLDGRYGALYVMASHILAYAYLTYCAGLVSKIAHSPSGLWIAAIYGLVTLTLVCVLADEAKTHLENYFLLPTPINVLLVLSGIASAFLGHIGYVGMVLDRTREREEAALAENVRLEVTFELNERIAHLQRQQMMGDFAVCLAHEINQPLTVILSCANLAKKGIAAGRVDEIQLTALVDHILSGSRRANYIIDQVRRYIRPLADSGRPADIGQVILETIDILRLDSRFSEVEIQHSPLELQVLVVGDGIQISQILINAIRNALEAARETPGGGRVLIDLGVEATHVDVYIRDSGPGFSAEALQKAGHAFYSTKLDGLGVGLSISRDLAAHFGGSLTWGNAPEGGGVSHLRLIRFQDVSEGRSA